MYVWWFQVEAVASCQCRVTRRETGLLTFHCHWYSSTVGGLVFFLGPDSDSPSSTPSSPFPPSSISFRSGWPLFLPSGCPPFVAISSNSSNSSFVEGSPNSFTAGSPVLSDLNFKVKRGPISCNAAFSVDLKAYLDTRELAYRHKVTG